MKDSRFIQGNLLSLGLSRRVLGSPWFPIAFQAAFLLLGAALVWNGWGIGAGLQDQDLKILRKTNLTVLAVWGLWWPGMILIVLGFGRLWCTVCPMELASRVGRWAGFRLGTARLPLGRFLRAGWFVFGAYVVLQVLVAGLSLHRIPHGTALLVLALGGLAFGAGLGFVEERAFCKTLCPAAGLLSVYGRHARLQLGKVDGGTCESCTTKDCVKLENRDHFDARSCPSLLRPFERHPSDGCVLCFQCAKACPHGNLGYGSLSAEASSYHARPLKPSEAAFVLVAAGFVSHEVMGEVPLLDALFHWAPSQLARLLAPLGFGWCEALWFLALFPALFWSMALLVGWAAGEGGRVGPRLLVMAGAAAPVVALAHLAKALAKIGSWGGYLPMALQDPTGLAAMRSLARHHVADPGVWWGIPALGRVLFLGVAALALGSLRRPRRRLEGDFLPSHRIGFTSATFLYLGILFSWLWV